MRLLCVWGIAAAAGCDGTSGGRGDGSAPDTALLPTTPADEVELGPPVTATLDPRGGVLRSFDGLFVLTVPAGALSAPIEITVQPIANALPGGRGDAVRLGPEGTTFDAPVTLTFNYGTEGLVGGPPEALRIASLGADGRWHEQPGATLDEAAGTVSVPSTHFSQWAAGLTHWLAPRVAAIGTADTLALEVVDCEADPGSALVPEGCDAPGDVVVTEWAVNGAAGGTARDGLVAASGDGTGLYTAPAEVPATNPATVTARLEIGGVPSVLSAFVSVVDGPTYVGAVSSTFTTKVGSTTSTTRSVANVAFLYSAGAGHHVPQGNLAGHIHVHDDARPCDSNGHSGSTILSTHGSLVITGDTYRMSGLSWFTDPGEVPGRSTCNDSEDWRDAPMLYTALSWFPDPEPYDILDPRVLGGSLLDESRTTSLVARWHLDRVDP